jgi:hypothetical protein
VDWKAHKPICKTLKKLSHQLQPYRIVVQLTYEILDEEFRQLELNVRVLEHLVSYAEYQFGNRVPLKNYRERENGEAIYNWTVEIKILVCIYGRLVDLYTRDESLNIVSSNNLKFPLFEKMLNLLRPWSVDLDSLSIGGIDSITKDQNDKVLYLSSSMEIGIGIIYMHRNQLNLAETHCQRGLSYARFHKGTEETKADLLCGALRIIYILRREESNYAGALIFAEEAYNCVAIAYNPVHPQVQNAASTLIECLTLKGDLCKAELFAQMTLDSLKDPQNGLDQQSEAVARGYYDLANVIITQRGDLVKAEKLVRESLRIRVQIKSNSYLVGYSLGLLTDVLRFRSKLGSEMKEVLEQCLAIDIRNYGPDGANTAGDYGNIGIYYRELADAEQTAETRKEFLRLSEIKIKEALRIYTKIYGPDDPKTLRYSTELFTVRRLISRV